MVKCPLTNHIQMQVWAPLTHFTTFLWFPIIPWASGHAKAIYISRPLQLRETKPNEAEEAGHMIFSQVFGPPPLTPIFRQPEAVYHPASTED